MEKIIYQSETICNGFKELKLGKILSDVHKKHLTAIATSVFIQDQL